MTKKLSQKPLKKAMFLPGFIQTKKCRHKQCKYKGKQQPITNFYKYTEHRTMPKHHYADGHDFYCKDCRKKYQNVRNRSETWNEAIQCWKKLFNDPRNQRLDNMMYGFANFDMHVAPVPHITYIYIVPIHKSRRPTYVHAFNYLYAYPYLSIECPDYYQNPMSAAFDHSILDKELINRNLTTTDDIPVGLHNVNNILKALRNVIPYFFAYKKCIRCKETKQTYANPLPTLEEEPLTDEFYIQTIHLATMKQIRSVRKFNFQRSYQSLDGWNSLCNSCREETKNSRPKRGFASTRRTSPSS